MKAGKLGLRISITFGPSYHLSPPIRRGIENAILTPTESKTAVWIADRLTYRSHRSPEEVMGDWKAHGYSCSDFQNVQIAPWVERRHDPEWTGRNRRLHPPD